MARSEGKTEEDRDGIVREKKMDLSGENLCKGIPGQFATYIDYSRSFHFEDKPDYASIPSAALPPPFQVKGVQVRQCV